MDKWIPVSERLPEEGQEILFSTKTGRVHSGKYHDDDSANQWYSHKDKCRAWNNVVSAWMPLPKPYEPQESYEEPKTEHCKNCKYFEYDSVAKVDGIPLIVAHEICNKWGNGCKTKEDGYCYLFEPQESEARNECTD